MTLPPAFLDRPIAHRALHDLGQGRAENSREAVLAAVSAGYGIEIDLQLTSDGAALVFHDYDTARLTGTPGPVRGRTAADMDALGLIGGASGPPTLGEVLALVAGRVPVLIEIKDQDGAMGPNVGLLEAATAEALSGYEGPVAVMSFNPHSVAEMARLAPDVPRGITTCAYEAEDWPTLPAARRAELATIPDLDRTGACFVSHSARHLVDARVAEIKGQGFPILCWTIRSPAEEAQARKIADNITFEGYLA